MIQLSFSNVLLSIIHDIIIVQSQRGVPGVGEGMLGVREGMLGVREGMLGLEEGMPGMGEGMPGMGEGMPGMGEGMPGMGESMPGMGNVQKQLERAEAAARLILSTSSLDEILEGSVYFASDHFASPQWGWLTEIPSDDKGPGCSPLTRQHKEGQLIALIKRGGCNFIEKATNGGTKDDYHI